MKVIEFIDMLNNLTDEEKQFKIKICIEYDEGNRFITHFNIDDLEYSKIDRILSEYVIIYGK